MTNYNFLKKLEKDGTLNELTRRGLFPLSVTRYKNIVEDFNTTLAELQEKTKVKEQRDKAADVVAEKQGVTKQTVYTALRLMREQ